MNTTIFTYARRLTQPLIALIALSGAACATPPVQTMPTGTLVLAVATWNLDAGRGDLARFVADLEIWRALFSDLARRRQAEALIDALPEDGFGVLGGGFNAWLGPQEPAWRVLLDRFDDTLGVMRTATFRDRLVLDHLMFDLPPGWHAVTSVARDRYGSDHHPVVAAISASSHGARR